MAMGSRRTHIRLMARPRPGSRDCDMMEVAPCQEEEKRARAAEVVKKDHLDSTRATWHEKHFKLASSSQSMPAAGRTKNPLVAETSHARSSNILVPELEAAARLMAMERKERLRALLAAENRGYEAELAAAGLAIARNLE
eukprot:jgi/Mesvir1/15932/Mv08255-RA.1